MALTFREATEEEYDDVRRVTLDAYLGAGYFGADNPYVSTLADVEDRAKSAVIWVGEADGKVVSAAALVQAGDPYADIAREGELEFRMLAVDPAVQGQGIGRKTVESIEDYARTLPGVHTVSLTSAEQMLGAHRLYAAMGFDRVPERDWLVPNENIKLLVFTKSVAR